MNPIHEANTIAWERFDHSEQFTGSREDFDAGWEAALEYTAPLLRALLGEQDDMIEDAREWLRIVDA